MHSHIYHTANRLAASSSRSGSSTGRRLRGGFMLKGLGITTHDRAEGIWYGCKERNQHIRTWATCWMFDYWVRSTYTRYQGAAVMVLLKSTFESHLAHYPLITVTEGLRNTKKAQCTVILQKRPTIPSS